MRSVVERYYEEYFFTNDGGEDQFVNQHSNGMCVVGVAPGHPLLKDKKTVTGMYYGTAKLRNKVAGKSKKGGMWVEPETTLCVVGTNDSRYILKCGIKGELLEVNAKIQDKPSLMTDYPRTEGFLALIMPRRGQEALVTKNLITFEEYYEDRPYLVKPTKLYGAELEIDFDE
eukprot:TRINITY_DN394_c0_g2_i3.p1 TRINITY_DN394_c0_g2~~TRINITY_DN394_c0_g2_i3.p1  ORF type:complete len:172 (-),score=41.16 TRINITY_DN394_c0_g2_i3:53-568(-)